MAIESKTEMTFEQLTGAEKVAILLASLGAEASSQIFKGLDEAEIETLSAEISRMQDMPGKIAAQVLEEFHHMAKAQEYVARGGFSYASQVLEKALGKGRAFDIIDRLKTALQPPAFHVANKSDPKVLLDFVRREHPQTIALILANMEPEKAARVIAGLAAELQIDVVLRIASMDKTNPDVVKQIERIIETRLSNVYTQEMPIAGGVKAVAEILNRMDRNTERNIFQSIEGTEPAMAEDIRKLMFSFEDIVAIDDRGIQRILREIDQKDLALSLKAAAPDVGKKIYKNMSDRASTLLREEISYLGPTRLRDVEEAQQRIVSIVRRLEESGEIIVQGRGGAEDVLV